MSNKPSFVFFGTPDVAVTILDELKSAGYVPNLIVTAPDKPQGRHFTMTPPAVKVWAEAHGIEVYQPATVRDEAAFNKLSERAWDVFIVAAYGKIIPQTILDIPVHKTLNVHLSLLPKLRGASPIESAILNDMRETGSTIMRLDAEMDHGPVVAQETLELETWPITRAELADKLAHQGGKLLSTALPGWIAGTIQEIEQDHTLATYTKKTEKTDGEIDLAADPYQNYLKYCAYATWPRTYFYVEHAGKKIRVTVVSATYTKENGLVIDQVVPEGKKQMNYSDFLRGLK